MKLQSRDDPVRFLKMSDFSASKLTTFVPNCALCCLMMLKASQARFTLEAKREPEGKAKTGAKTTKFRRHD
jgi:hypothetical protein